MAERKRKGPPDDPGVPGWIVTYGDMMSLLLTFFVLLLSFSTISEKEFEKAMMSLKGALGVLPKNRAVVQINPLPKPPRRPPRSIQRLARELKRRLQIMGKEQLAQIEYGEGGDLKITLPSKVLFDTARADLKPEATEVLASIADVFSGVASLEYIEVRGHTDNRPLRSSTFFKDNHDLSYGRSDAVARFLSSSGNILLERFEIVGCGEGQPVAINDTLEGMQQNRRVEIFLRGEFTSETMEELTDQIESLDGL